MSEQTQKHRDFIRKFQPTTRTGTATARILVLALAMILPAIGAMSAAGF